MRTTPVRWTEPRLFDHGYEQLSLKFRIHVHGPDGLLSAGWSLHETTTDAWVAACVQTTTERLGCHEGSIGMLLGALEETYGALRPF